MGCTSFDEFQSLPIVMTMGSVSRESSVLKLVHPRGFVEIHKNPITASEIMKKNPRHFVTRPDVFKFPWIVVKPESVLKPGAVYFVVPYHTIRSLLRSKGNHPSIGHHKDLYPNSSPWTRFLKEKDQMKPSSLEQTEFHRFMRKPGSTASLLNLNQKNTDCNAHFLSWKSSVGPNKQEQDQFDKRRSSIKSRVEVKIKEEEEESDESTKKQFPVEHWPKALRGYKSTRRPQTKVNSFVEEKSIHSSLTYAPTDAPAQARLPRIDYHLLEKNSNSQQVPELKSCLKKRNNNITKSHYLRVRFAIQGENDEKNLRVKSTSFNRL